MRIAALVERPEAEDHFGFTFAGETDVKVLGTAALAGFLGPVLKWLDPSAKELSSFQAKITSETNAKTSSIV